MDSDSPKAELTTLLLARASSAHPALDVPSPPWDSPDEATPNSHVPRAGFPERRGGVRITTFRSHAYARRDEDVHVYRVRSPDLSRDCGRPPERVGGHPTLPKGLGWGPRRTTPMGHHRSSDRPERLQRIPAARHTADSQEGQAWVRATPMGPYPSRHRPFTDTCCISSRPVRRCPLLRISAGEACHTSCGKR